MWRMIKIIMVSYYVLIFGVLSRPVEEPKEGPLWGQTITDLVGYNEDISADKYRRIPASDPLTYNKETADYYVVLLPPQKKKAMSMFARWTPISNMGLSRTPIRSANLPPELDMQKHNRRMLGQPLRWG